jgi:DNA-binding MarR family transcriptional regulator
VVARARAFDIVPGALPLTHLAFFVGTFANRKLAAEMQRAGYADLRESYGYLFQHLLGGPCSVGELSRRLGVTQQAVSKTVAELTRAGYVETAAGDDARVRLVRLSQRGHACVLTARRLREKLERRLIAGLGRRRAEAVRGALSELLEALGGVDAVRGRRVPPIEGQPES